MKQAEKSHHNINKLVMFVQKFQAPREENEETELMLKCVRLEVTELPETRWRTSTKEVEVSNYVPCIEKLKNEVMVQNLLQANGMKDCKRKRGITYKTGPSDVNIFAERSMYSRN